MKNQAKIGRTRPEPATCLFCGVELTKSVLCVATAKPGLSDYSRGQLGRSRSSRQGPSKTFPMPLHTAHKTQQNQWTSGLINLSPRGKKQDRLSTVSCVPLIPNGICCFLHKEITVRTQPQDAQRLFWKATDKHLIDIGFKQSTIDPCL